jgi:hypothetical protein
VFENLVNKKTFSPLFATVLFPALTVKDVCPVVPLDCAETTVNEVFTKVVL